MGTTIIVMATTRMVKGTAHKYSTSSQLEVTAALFPTLGGVWCSDSVHNPADLHATEC